MIELDFCKKDESERKKIVSDYCEKILERRDRKKLQLIEDWCEEYLSGIDGESYPFKFKDVICAPPKTLLRIRDYLEQKYVTPQQDKLEQINQELYTDGKNHRYTYIESTLYNRMNVEAKSLLLQSLGVRVCPYCNRNYVVSDGDAISCELDHYLPKSRYPIFMVSFYNLIPSCPICNKNKGTKAFKLYPHQMQKSTDQLLQFSYYPSGADYLSDQNDIHIRMDVMDSDYQEQAKSLKLEKLYSSHTDVVQDILRKNYIFGEQYVHGLYNQFQNLFSDEQEIRELIYGTPLKEEEYGKRPLAKFTADIVREVESI